MSTTQVKQELAAYFPLLSERQQQIVPDMIKNLLHIDKKEITDTGYRPRLPFRTSNRPLTS